MWIHFGWTFSRTNCFHTIRTPCLWSTAAKFSNFNYEDGEMIQNGILEEMTEVNTLERITHGEDPKNYASRLRGCHCDTVNRPADRTRTRTTLACSFRDFPPRSSGLVALGLWSSTSGEEHVVKACSTLDG